MQKKTVPSEGSPAGSVSSSQKYYAGWAGRVWSGSLVRGAAELAHKSFGTTSSLPGSQTVLTAVDGLSCVNQKGQHDGSFLPESSRRITFSPPVQAGEECSKFLSVRAVLYPKSPELRSRLALETEAGGRGMET